MTKTCGACKQAKPDDDFGKQQGRNKSNGRIYFDSNCKKCKKCITNRKARQSRKMREINERENGRQDRFVPAQKTCTACNKLLGKSKFSKATKTLDGLTKRCSECICFREKRRVRELRAYLWSKLPQFGGRCVRCGLADPNVLEFDHRDPTTKTYKLAQLKSRAAIDAELPHIQLLCIFCHRLKSRTEMIERIRLRVTAPRSAVQEKKGAYRSAALDRNHAYTLRRKLEIGGCKLCMRKVATDGSDACCFDFDHVDRTTKTACVSTFTCSDFSTATIEAEIRQCILLCCYCHRLRTRLQMRQVLQGPIHPLWLRAHDAIYAKMERDSQQPGEQSEDDNESQTDDIPSGDEDSEDD